MIKGGDTDHDPLPNEENSVSDTDHASNDDGQNIKINITNELGETLSSKA